MISFPKVLEDSFIDQPGCECCGHRNFCVSGWVEDNSSDIAQYYVYWTEGRPDHGACFDLIIGKAGPNDSPGNRSAVSLSYSIAAESLMFIEPSSRAFASGRAKYCKFHSPHSISPDLAADATGLVNFVLSNDSRLVGLRREG